MFVIHETLERYHDIKKVQILLIITPQPKYIIVIM